MWEYKKPIYLLPDLLARKLRRQKKNLFRRKRVSIFRLKTKGFGFLSSACLKTITTVYFLKKQSKFYTYNINFIQPDAFFKNITKVQTFVIVSNFFFANFLLFFNNIFLENLYPITIVFFNKIIKSFFFIKFFFFKFFFFKLKKLYFFLNKFTLNLFK